MKEDQLTYLHKWLNGELSEEELKAFKQTDLYKENAHLVDVFEGAKIPNYDVEEEFVGLLNQKESLQQSKGKLVTMKNTWLRVAATVVLLVSIGYLASIMLNNDIHEHHTQIGEISTVTLPDASNVWVNAKTTLLYNAENWRENREVELQGEGYFQVAKGNAFTVKTKGGSVTVLGTKFNVKNRNDLFEVTCYEGKVQVIRNSKEIILEKGDGLRAVASELEVFEHKVTDTEAPIWIENRSYFKEIPILEVLEDIKLHYEVEIHLDASIDRNQKFTGGYYYNESIEKTLSAICSPFALSYKIEGSDVYIK